MQVTVYQNQVEKALKLLKRRLSNEGVFKELKRKRFYIKPSLKKKLKKEEAARQRMKDFRKAIRKGEQAENC